MTHLCTTMRVFNIICFLFVGWSVLAQSEEPWDKVTESDGIETKIGIDSASGFPIFESTVLINAEMQDVYAQLTDHANLKNWVYGLSESVRVDSLAAEGAVVYYRLDLPWPVRDRDVVVKQTVAKSDDQIVLTITETESDYEPNPGLVRIGMLLTHWEFYKASDETTRVVYRSKADAMGIPNWIVKLFLSTSPKETLKKLRENLEGETQETTKKAG